MNGIRNTIQKSLIYDSVFQMKNHPTAEMIYEHIAKSHNNISIATVYRNLNQLSEGGEIQKIDITNAPSIYDFNLNRHYHFKCVICGNVYDYEVDGIEKLEEIVKTDKKFTIDSIELIVKGKCTKCKKK